MTVNNRGDQIFPGEGVVPLLKRIADKQYRVVGTAFFVTRYGLLLTAKHVVEDLVPPGHTTIEDAFVLQDSSLGLLRRRVTGASLSVAFDIGAVQVENGMEETPPRPGPPNLIGDLSLDVPVKGAELVTWSYPENAILDFADPTQPPIMRAGYFTGQYLENVGANERPFVPHPHYETSLVVRPGASGSPVFYNGRIIGIASRSWNFADPDALPLLGASD